MRPPPSHPAEACVLQLPSQALLQEPRVEEDEEGEAATASVLYKQNVQAENRHLYLCTSSKLMRRCYSTASSQHRPPNRFAPETFGGGRAQPAVLRNGFPLGAKSPSQGHSSGLQRNGGDVNVRGGQGGWQGAGAALSPWSPGLAPSPAPQPDVEGQRAQWELCCVECPHTVLSCLL